jgi:hypothetical protein
VPDEDVVAHQHTVVSSTPICVAALASCLDGEVACTTAQRSADPIAPSGHEFTFLQVAGHVDDDHMCSALVHMCGEVRVNFSVTEGSLLQIYEIASPALSKE